MLVGQRANAVRYGRSECGRRTGQLAAVQRGTQCILAKSLLGTQAVGRLSFAYRSAQSCYL